MSHLCQKNHLTKYLILGVSAVSRTVRQSNLFDQKNQSCPLWWEGASLRIYGVSMGPNYGHNYKLNTGEK